MLICSSHTNAVVRNNSIAALGKIKAEPTLVLPALIKCLNDPIPFVRAQAANSLAKFGKEAQSAVPALLELRRKETAASTPKGPVLNMSGFF